MAAGAQATIPPPPVTESGGAITSTAPTTPPGAATSPARSSPQSESASRMVIQVVQNLRAIAKAFPGASAPISKMNDLLREVQMQVMKNSEPGEAASPPVPSA